MQTADYIVLILYLTALAAVAWHFRRVSARPVDFFLAGRSFGAVPVGLSVMVTTFSAVNYLALPGEVSGHGLYVLAALPAFFLAALLVVRWWIPVFRKSEAVSVYAFLEKRFDWNVRLLASAIFLLWRLFWMATALFASCKMMSILSGVSLVPMVLLCGITAALYSSVGGMKAVVWTDVMQFAVLFGSIVIGTFYACQAGSFGESLLADGTLKPFYPVDWRFLSPDPTLRITLWSALFGSFVTFLTRFGADQMVMQRYLSASSEQAAARGLWISGIASTVSLAVLALFGLAVHAFARNVGLPAGAEPIKQIALLLHRLPAGIPGLITAGLLAATMSSIDSGLNSCAAAWSADFGFLFRKKSFSPKLLTWLFAFPVILGASWILPELNRNSSLFVILNKTVNAIGTPLLALMVCALFWKKAASAPVFLGVLGGSLLTIVFSCTVKTIALHYYAVLSGGATFALILLFHLLHTKCGKK